MQELRPEVQQGLRDNLARVRERMAMAAERSGRRPDSVDLVAVTKRCSAEAVPVLLEAGVQAIGENRPEEILRKQELLGTAVPWHMIGHMQRKKIHKSIHLIDLLHSCHSLSLLSKLDHSARNLAKTSIMANVLIQVNVAAEDSKQGFSLAKAKDALEIAEAFPNLSPAGFMVMTPRGADQDERRKIFSATKKLQEQIGVDRAPVLSMGMSSDFETAIEEGATIVRVGSALFDGLALDR